MTAAQAGGLSFLSLWTLDTSPFSLGLITVSSPPPATPTLAPGYFSTPYGFPVHAYIIPLKSRPPIYILEPSICFWLRSRSRGSNGAGAEGRCSVPVAVCDCPLSSWWYTGLGCPSPVG